ncbi:hypothetical protein ABAC460_02985 [Asticcacaulis sp. AC460]|uniref:hypothetical protein n=1 Tax=Asticcacaulis sp. AC460 TaxID=1282360 RepID=UPI0003C3AD12|nr:hypothetical protein [Asticcacaulis sp. AC460]ESQ92474.1 hypothetical protein ABAC460_02985 [Asticcacaulis sp. AC460]
MNPRLTIPLLTLSLSAIILAACGSGSEIPPPKTAPASNPGYTPPTRVEPSTPAPSAPSAPQFKPVANDQCGAGDLQYLIGKPRTEIPVPLHPGKRRVVCSTCAVTMDYSADRQTIVFDTDTGLIQSVKCG